MTTSYQSALAPQEANEELYIKTCGEKGTASIVDSFFDKAPESLSDEVKAELIPHFQVLLLRYVSDLTRAEWASKSCDGPEYSEWIADQE